jgi:uncharacterized protein (TIGR00369 family)
MNPSIAVDLPTIVARARSEGDFSLIVDALPYFRFLGLRVQREGNPLTVILPYQAKHIGRKNPLSIHGGVISALLEATALLQLMAGDTARVAKTISITTDFLRAAAAPSELYATASITRQGRRVANVRIEAWQEDRAKPVAIANGNFLLA